MLARGLEQHVGAERVRGDERVGLGDRAVDVRLGGEVDDRVWSGRVDRGGDRRRVLDGAAQEAEGGLVDEIVEVLLAAGVGELVEHGHLVAVLVHPLAREGRADEAGAATDEQFHGRIIPARAAR